MRRILFFMIMLWMPVLVTAAAVYKWTDADGNVHFTTTPPPHAAGSEERVAEHRVPPAEDLLPLVRLLPRWAWKGERDSWHVRMTFNNRGYYIESLVRPSQGSGGRPGRSYLGKWHIENRTLVFSGSVPHGKGADILPPPSAMEIDYFRDGVFKTRSASGVPVYFRHDVGSSSHAFPEEYR